MCAAAECFCLALWCLPRICFYGRHISKQLNFNFYQDLTARYNNQTLTSRNYLWNAIKFLLRFTNNSWKSFFVFRNEREHTNFCHHSIKSENSNSIKIHLLIYVKQFINVNPVFFWYKLARTWNNLIPLSIYTYPKPLCI